MKMKKTIISLLSLAFILGFSQVGRVWAAKMENLTIGGDIRLRGIVTENYRDFNDESEQLSSDRDDAAYYDFRTRLWLKAELDTNVSGYVRLVADPWGGNPDTGPYTSAWTNDLIIDNSYIEIKSLFNSPLTLKFGRQDMFYGEGLLIADGTAADGSRTGYFEAVKLSGVFGQTSVDLFAAKVTENNPDCADDEDLYGLYATNKNLADHTFEGYLLQRVVLGKGPSGPGLPNDSQTSVIGLRSTGKIVENLNYGAEVAKQFGVAGQDAAGDDIDRDALGAYLHLTYAMPEISCKPSIKLGVTYTTGDDEETNDKNEGWDSFYANFPKYGEILAGIDKYDPDAGGPWTNMMIYELTIKAQPMEKMTTTLAYAYVAANEENDSEGTTRGQYPKALIEYKFTDALSTHLLAEYFIPDDYYKNPGTTAVFGDAEDEAFFGRFEMMLKF